MEREANYAAVGAFVLAVIVMASLFVYWYSDTREHRDYTRYEIYFEGTVSGLNRGAAVRYLGVDVGRVFSLRIDKRSAGRVQVIADIDSSAPVSARTVAELSLQGVTGLLYIDLLGDAGTKPLGPLVPSDRYPVIRSVRSNFDVFIASLPEAVGKLAEVADRAGRILSDDNIAAIGSMLARLDDASAHLPDTLRDVRGLAKDLRAASDDVQATARNVRRFTDESGPDLAATVKRARAVADNLASATARLDALLAENRGDVRGFARDGLPELQALLREGRAAARELRDLSQSLRENPSRLIYQPSPTGVEIPR
jgi:phospholipid/cholesterol/gamma-HCH transport system substrate-binding protein